MQQVSEPPSFLRLNNIPWHEWATLGLLGRLLMVLLGFYLFTVFGRAGCPCCVRAFLAVVNGGYLLVAVHGLLVVVAALAVEHGL